ncbi:hypothetical protein BH11PSE7_BH11PSE7_31850 [soil metagenome]
MTISLANISPAASATISAFTPDSDSGNAALMDTTRALMVGSQIRKKLVAALAGLDMPTASGVSKVKGFTAALSDASNAIANKEANLGAIQPRG